MFVPFIYLLQHQELQCFPVLCEGLYCTYMNRCVFFSPLLLLCACLDKKTTFIELETVAVFFLRLLNEAQWRCQFNKG